MRTTYVKIRLPVESPDFSKSLHTIVVSDIHLSDAESPHPSNPYWKRYKRPKYFVDRTFKEFLAHIRNTIPAPIELILNGDIFDFDSVMAIPPPEESPVFSVSWLEKSRGLAPEESKSRFKVKRILSDHPVWIEAIRDFITCGNRVVFIIGNHDIELHWPSVQEDILTALGLTSEQREQVRFCEWFYLSNQDTLVEHGNQYDAYCLALNPINPLIKNGSNAIVRLPFGNMAGKYMLNGMGLINPHFEGSFIKNSIAEYMTFYYKYVMRTQPLLLWTWLWSAFVTLYSSLSEGIQPAMVDPLTIDARVEDIARRSNTSARVVWTLKELQAHPAIFNPLKLLQELWLDRAILLALIVLGSFQFFTVLRVFVTVSFWWFVIPLILLIGPFLFYARGVESEVDKMQLVSFTMAPLSARLARVRRVIHGHLHRELHTQLGGVEYLNTGTWSPAFRDVECTQPYGRKCFAWIKPADSDPTQGRIAELYEWKENQIERVPLT